VRVDRARAIPLPGVLAPLSVASGSVPEGVVRALLVGVAEGSELLEAAEREGALWIESSASGPRFRVAQTARSDGGRDTTLLAQLGEAYEAAGWVVLDQCDLLIAIWDGKAPRGLGGTGQIVHEALRRGIPTVSVF